MTKLESLQIERVQRRLRIAEGVAVTLTPQEIEMLEDLMSVGPQSDEYLIDADELSRKGRAKIAVKMAELIWAEALETDRQRAGSAKR